MLWYKPGLTPTDCQIVVAKLWSSRMLLSQNTQDKATDSKKNRNSASKGIKGPLLGRALQMCPGTVAEAWWGEVRVQAGSREIALSQQWEANLPPQQGWQQVSADSHRRRSTGSEAALPGLFWHMLYPSVIFKSCCLTNLLNSFTILDLRAEFLCYF